MKFVKYNKATLDEAKIIETISNQKEIVDYMKKVALDNNYDSDEASINLPFDDTWKNQSRDLAAKLKHEKLKYVFIIGIGGSNLGTMAVYNALFGQLDYLNAKVRLPKLIFIETVSALFVSQVRDIIENQLHNANEVVVNMISKSGGTTETISLFEIVSKMLSDKFGTEAIHEQVVVTTDKDSKLWNSAVEKKYSVLEIPKKVGGRYSVFSNVGLFPLAMAGVDIEKLLEGAQISRNNALQYEPHLNTALLSAVLIYLHSQNGFVINNNFFFNPEMESIGKWYRQLMGESIGKEHDINGKVVHAGITPIVSIGSTDLHSMAQLYFGGPINEFTNFIYSPALESANVPEDMVFPLVNGISGKSLTKIMDAIYEGVKATYENRTLPYMEVILDKVDEFHIGEYLQFKMMEITYLARLLNVNAFDQPNVEEYKIETKKLLEAR